MKPSPALDQFARRLQKAGLLREPVDRMTWIDLFEKKLGENLPTQYGSFVRRYLFKPFEWGPVMFFGNSGADHPYDLHITAWKDPAIWQAVRKAGLLQFGRPETANYDPVCFDLAGSLQAGEPRIVQLDHEAIFIENRVKIVKTVASSFSELIEDLIASTSEPMLTDFDLLD